jgi:cholesterol transport system auxiliary component
MRRVLALPAAAALLAACSALQPPQEIVNTYVLDARPVAVSQPPTRDLVLAISVPRARAGFDTPQMAYERRPHELEYYARNRWADAPSRMLAPLLEQALQASGGLRGVVPASSPAAADLRLDVELVRLLQDFATRPSRIRLTVHAQLIDVGSRRVLATREFDEIENAPSDDAYGGVIAANRALERLLGRMIDFCADQPADR